MQVRLISKDVDDIQEKLDDMADVNTGITSIEKSVDNAQKEKKVKDITSQIKDKLKIP